MCDPSATHSPHLDARKLDVELVDHSGLVLQRIVEVTVQGQLRGNLAHMLERHLAVLDATDPPGHFFTGFSFSSQPCFTWQNSLPGAASRPHP
jgi:hypothetical protein